MQRAILFLLVAACGPSNASLPVLSFASTAIDMAAPACDASNARESYPAQVSCETR